MHPTNIDKDAIRADWASQDFSCDLWVDPPGQIWHDFQHEVDEMVVLLEGECLIEWNERVVRMVAGDELMIPAGTRHTVRNSGSGPARWLHGYRNARAEH